MDRSKNLPQKFTRISLLILVLSLSTGILNTHPAHATLGEALNSIDKDETTLAARSRVLISHKKFSVHRLVTSGSTINEYVGRTGTVFGVCWHGLKHPDPSQILGTYAKDFHAEAKRALVKNHSNRRHAIHTNRLVFQRWGHMGNRQGCAYDPNLLPSDVTINDFQ